MYRYRCYLSSLSDTSAWKPFLMMMNSPCRLRTHSDNYNSFIYSLFKLDQIKQLWSALTYAVSVGPRAWRQSFVTHLPLHSSLPYPLPETGVLVDVIQLTRRGRLPVALHYDPIQSAQLPASTAPSACSQNQKRITTDPNHHCSTVPAICWGDYVCKTSGRAECDQREWEYSAEYSRCAAATEVRPEENRDIPEYETG